MGNRERVFETITCNPQITRARLAQLLGLPRTTVTGVITVLLDDGLIAEHAAPHPAGRRGRPTTVLHATGAPRLVAAAVITTSDVRVALLDYHASTWACRRAQLEVDDAEAVVRAAAGMVDELVAELALDRPPELDRVVLGLPAPIRHGRGIPTFEITGCQTETYSDGSEANPDERQPRYAPWLAVDLAALLRDHWHHRAVTENDANLGALGELAFGAARGYTDFIYLKISPHGFGAGLVLGGGLHRGTDGFAGEIAHLHVNDDGPLCRCGGRGCLSGVLGPALTENLNPPRSPRTGAAQDYRDPTRVFRAIGTTLGRFLAGTCTILNPQAIVLDADLAPHHDHVRHGITTALRDHAAPVTTHNLEIIAGTLPDAELAGAVALARATTS